MYNTRIATSSGNLVFDLNSIVLADNCGGQENSGYCRWGNGCNNQHVEKSVSGTGFSMKNFKVQNSNDLMAELPTLGVFTI